MTKHAKCFETRKKSAEETARWLMPVFHRAQMAKDEDVTIPTRDLGELLGYMESVRHREEVEFGGKHLGYCDPDAIRALLGREKQSINILFKPTRRFCTKVNFVELPPKAFPPETE